MSSPPTPAEVLANYRDLYRTLLSSSHYSPFIYPLHALNINVVILYILLPPTRSKFVFYLRYPIFCCTLYLSIQVIWRCRSPTVTVGYLIGLLAFFAILWSATLIIFGDARGEYRRWELREGSEFEEANGEAKAKFAGDRRGLRQRMIAEGTTDVQSSIKAKEPQYYHPQPLPPTFLHRLDWTFDLITNFRGYNWSYHSSDHPPKDPSPFPAQSRQHMFRSALSSLILHYFYLDTLKFLTSLDPYYYYPFSSLSQSPFPFPYTTRLILSLVSAYMALDSIFLLSPIFFLSLHPLSSKYPFLRQYTDLSVHQPFFGSLSAISRKGIGALWGTCWHQLFRLGFERAGEFAASRLGSGWKRGTNQGDLLRLFVVFWVSGALHACASYTALGPTKPLRRAFLFFAIQPLGILGQRAVSGYIRSQGWRNRIPTKIRQSVNVAVVIGWCWSTGGLIADDFAASGIWLLEPVPISIWRGGRWGWGGKWFGWKSDGRWWERGLVF